MTDAQRGSLSYMEKRRGRKEIELTRRRRGGFKKREKDLAKSQFPKCFLQPRIPKEIHRVGYRRGGREEIEVTWGRTKRVKRRRGQTSQ